ncbi:hypothetical protein [Streptomyces sp. NPDC050535]|uniref:hypothetical protein n=1 Tax=Streptomyces sp. NPDC050535 TaxID=3365626 RepID=UPI0037AE79AD
MPAQQYLLETLGIEPAGEGEAVGRCGGAAVRRCGGAAVRRSQDERWDTNLAAAARQFPAREGHLRPSRGHREYVNGELIKLGVFLDELGMRWASEA